MIIVRSIIKIITKSISKFDYLNLLSHSYNILSIFEPTETLTKHFKLTQTNRDTLKTS